ncbi:hypothetical protein C8R44DRAFT_785992 [Mycena epipterygia]|nr:hypothetical protein C8R44DRAFT_785992 [Mycena epipterygia]
MSAIDLIIPSHGQVVARPLGELVWTPPSGTLVSLPATLLPPASLPQALVPPVPDTLAETLLPQSAIVTTTTVVYAPPTIPRPACTRQLSSDMPARVCSCVIPCVVVHHHLSTMRAWTDVKACCILSCTAASSSSAGSSSHPSPSPSRVSTRLCPAPRRSSSDPTSPSGPHHHGLLPARTSYSHCARRASDLRAGRVLPTYASRRARGFLPTLSWFLCRRCTQHIASRIRVHASTKLIARRLSIPIHV